jgi:hypothetical protein
VKITRDIDPDVCGSVTIVTWTAKSDCEKDVVKTAKFTVKAPTPLQVFCPTPVQLPCVTMGELEIAYKAWRDGFYYSGDCPAFITDNLNQLPLWEDIAGTIDLSKGYTTDFTYIVDGLCDSGRCTSSFSVEPCVVTCETAYGRLDGAYTCFIDDGFGNWGWTNLIAEEGTYTMDLYAAAAHCNPANGMLVGYVEVVKAVGSMTVKYRITEPGVSMSEIHVYVGCGKYPKLRNGRETIAPGQYTYNAGVTKAIEYTVTFTDVKGPVYVIAHAVVCTVSGTNVVTANYTKSITCAIQTSQQTTQGPAAGPGRAVGRPKSDTLDESTGIRTEVFPNPFRGQTTISFSVGEDTRTVVEVYTLQGARVAVLFDEPVSAEDVHTVTFTPDVYTSRQIYLVVVRTDSGRTTRQILTY